MDHMPWLLERSAANGGKDPCGHALMASCPPEPYSALTNDIPFGHRYGDETRNGNGVGATGEYVQQQQPQQLIQQQQQQQMTANSSAGMSRNNNTAANKGISSSSAMEVDGADTSAPRTWELSKADLATLLDLSQKLNLDGEITPVMAWGMVLGHPRLGELGAKEIAGLAEDLTGKVRCYGSVFHLILFRRSLVCRDNANVTASGTDSVLSWRSSKSGTRWRRSSRGSRNHLEWEGGSERERKG